MDVLIALFLVFLGCAGLLYLMTRMPGKSPSGTLAPLTQDQLLLRDSMQADLNILAFEIGERNTFHMKSYTRACDFLFDSLDQTGLAVQKIPYDIDGQKFYNIEARKPGIQDQDIIIVGAHYDSVLGSPGANDNGSGVVAVLALAKRLAHKPLTKTVRFVLFANEEPPAFQTKQMGSWNYARRCRENKDRIIVMLSIETIGYYSENPGSQQYPFPFGFFYPDTGNFLAVVGQLKNRSLISGLVKHLRTYGKIPTEGVAAFSLIPGVGWSDHWAFWQEGYPAVMLTDTAPYRYPFYHSADDTTDKIDYEQLSRVVTALELLIENLAGHASL